MTEFTPNGFEVIESVDLCKLYPIKSGLTLPLRPGDCGYVLSYFLKAFDKTVEPLNVTATFGYSKRVNTNKPDEWSEHAAGTAVDTNSTDHPNGREGTYSTSEVHTIRGLQDELDGVLKWGGDFNDVKDEMHWELNATLDAIHLVARRLKKKNTVSLKRLKPGNRNIDVYMVKRALSRRGYSVGTMSLFFGSNLRKAYKQWQLDNGNENATGIPGQNSLERLGFKVVKE